MTWVKLDDKMLTHPRIASVGGLGFAVHVAGIIYCGQHLTDGFIPRGAVGLLLDLTGVGLVDGYSGDDATVLALIETGQPGRQSLEDAELWEWDDERNGWWIRDYLHYNPSRSEVQRGRANDAARKRKKAPTQAKRSGRNPGGVRAESSAPVPEPEPEPEGVKNPPSPASSDRARAEEEAEVISISTALRSGGAA